MPQKKHDGVTFDGLSFPVDLWRDQWNIPHIRAKTALDAFAALGFAHAQDRLWQMDLLRRRSMGRWAEWRGEEAVPLDRLARRVGGEAVSRRDYDALGPDAKAMLDRYALGVNAFIALGQWPTEYALLEEEPEAWRPWHSIAAMRQIGFLMGSIWLKLFRAAAVPVVGAEAAMELRYDDAGSDLLCMPYGEHAKRIAADLDGLRPAIEALLSSASPDLMGGGSNNWAIAPGRSATVRPVLMGDPHRELEVPSMYSQAHIACDEFDAIGLTVPGVPGFPHVAHNRHVAWCVTHAFMDIHDLYIEKFRAGGSEVLHRGTWEPAGRRTETIKVRGGAAQTVEIVETRHGPVIAGDPRQGSALALRSVQFAETDVSFDCLWPMLKAQSVGQLFDAVDDWGLIDHNLVAADVDGHIGHRVRAKVPRRPRINGWLPVPGWTGEHEWDGMLPPRLLPRSIDPAGGIIITANNRVTADSADTYLCTDCHPPHRAERIAELLDGLPGLSVPSMEPVYADVLSRPGIEMRDHLRKLTFTGAAETLRRTIAAWDGQMSAHSRAAAAYARLRLALTRLVAERCGLSRPRSTPEADMLSDAGMITHLWWVVPALLRADDRRLLNGMDWPGALASAAATAALSDADAEWGQVHAPVIRHPLSAVFPDRAGELDVGCAIVGGDNDTVFATGMNAGEGLATKYSALARHSFDVGNWDDCRWIVFLGASGDEKSGHRDDQNAAWARCGSIPMLYDWSVIAAQSSLQRLSSTREAP